MNYLKKYPTAEAELKRIIEQQGPQSAKSLLDMARDINSPLHPLFEWEDSKAAEKYRLQQAYSFLLASRFVVRLKDTVATKTMLIRTYLPQPNHGFATRESVLSDKDGRQAIVDKKIQALRSWCTSVSDISEFDDLRKSIQGLLDG